MQVFQRLNPSLRDSYSFDRCARFRYIWFSEFDGSAYKPRLHRRHSLYNIPPSPFYYRPFLLQHGCSAGVIWNPFGSVVPATMSAKPKYWNNQVPCVGIYFNKQLNIESTEWSEPTYRNERKIGNLACHGMWNPQSKVLGHNQISLIATPPLQLRNQGLQSGIFHVLFSATKLFFVGLTLRCQCIVIVRADTTKIQRVWL